MRIIFTTVFTRCKKTRHIEEILINGKINVPFYQALAKHKCYHFLIKS